MRLRHVQLDVVYPYPFGIVSEVAADCISGSLESFRPCGTADVVLEGILGRYDEIDHIKTGHLYHMSYDGKMADVQRVE